MSSLNKSIIGDYQTKTLEEKIKASTNGVDLNLYGYDHTSGKSPSDIVKSGAKAHVNRILFWLSSKPNDFIRESLKGGILYSLIGQLNKDTNLQSWENLIKSKFASEFSSDLDLLYLKLNTDVSYKKLIINMVVRDRLTNNTFAVATGAEA